LIICTFSLSFSDSAENRDLQDHPKEWWDTDYVAKVVEKVVKKWRVDAIITFDNYGVSGHINHRAASVGVRYSLLYLSQYNY
jgi:N-acetylglucosaminylphosphatidylinositol deacetylase